MFPHVFYHGKRFDAAVAGARIVPVKCEKCGCEYFYELARVGEGAVTAYLMAHAAAAESAQEKSQRDLNERLSHEAELVPCPKCNWINEELVHGYRRGRFRHAGALAFGIVVVGTAGSLIAAWFTSIGAARDRELLPYFLFVGPAIFAAIAVLILLFRTTVRSRIQPNVSFPLIPRLPPGSPPAMLFDDATGEFQVAARSPQLDAAAGDWHEFQLGRDTLPAVCCVCLKAAEAGRECKRHVANAVILAIPRCADCAICARRASWLAWVAITAIVLVAEAAVLHVMRLESPEYWIVFVACSIVAFCLAAWAARVITEPVKVRIADESRGILRMRFRNREYAPQVASRHF
jgi:hypothetical protein